MARYGRRQSRGKDSWISFFLGDAETGGYQYQVEYLSPKYGKWITRTFATEREADIFRAKCKAIGVRTSYSSFFDW